MRRWTIGGTASALLLLATVVQAHKSVHGHLEALHRRHREERHAKRTNETGLQDEQVELKKRGGKCAFPYDAGLVPVTPGSANAGWAMSPDQSCQPGNYCPYACPPGQVSMQWDPKATSYSYPASMNGGLYCDSNGDISKPFPDKAYCQATISNIGVVNNAGGEVAFCQTVLPGNEAMLIPTAVTGFSTLAVPGTDYWAGTAAHYYINPPGTSTDTACVWGTNNNPYGNWSPYVAGANEDASGQVFIKLGWNPIYLENTTPFRTQMPNWGVKIDCPNGGCNGLPCSIDPATDTVNQMIGSASSGAGGGAFCVVTVSKGSTANFVVFGSGGSGSDSGWKGKAGQFYQSGAASSSTAETSTTAESTSTATTSTSTTTSEMESHTSTTKSSTTQTASTSEGPTGYPYYSLFNNSAPHTKPEETGAYLGGAVAEATKASNDLTQGTAPLPKATGGAAVTRFSAFALLPLALWPLL